MARPHRVWGRARRPPAGVTRIDNHSPPLWPGHYSLVAGPDHAQGQHQGYSIAAMAWGTVELEPEVRGWLEDLPTARFATAAFYIDLLADQGPLLDEPYTRQLDGKLRELRFHLDRQAMRVTYWIAPDRRIVLLTVFAKTGMREDREVQRARKALVRCLAERHMLEEEGEGDG